MKNYNSFKWAIFWKLSYVILVFFLSNNIFFLFSEIKSTHVLRS